MNTIVKFFILSNRRMLIKSMFGLMITLSAISAHGQTSEVDDIFDKYFEDLYVDHGNDFVLEVETDDNQEETVQNLITVDPVRLFINENLLAGIKPKLRNRALVHADTFTDGAQVEHGSVLRFEIGFHAPEGVELKLRVSLFSKLPDPKHELHEDTEFELGGESLTLNWRKHKPGDKYASVATINDHIQSGRRPKYAKPRQSGQSDYFSHVFLDTANLKPGDYKLLLKVYRLENGDVVEEHYQAFHFTMVAARLNVVAFMPSAIVTYNAGKSLHDGEYEAAMSDWAVPPYSARLESSHPGFSLEANGETVREDMGENVFYIYARPNPRLAGRTVSLKLTVKDGLARVGTLDYEINVSDGRDFEIKVSMPSLAKAGQSITGTVKYPTGFKLKKPPTIGDRRGFAWTNSDYTAFRITPSEEGVHYNRLFAIIASGTMKGMEQDPVLVWKREYTVKSQNLIYDEERIRRRKETNKRAWNAALSALASGIGEVASSYGNATPSSNSEEEGDDGFYEIISTETHDPNAEEEDRFSEITSSDTSPNSQDKRNGGYLSEEVSEIWNRVNGPNTPSPSGDARPGMSEQLDFSNGEPKNICGIDNAAGEWEVDWDGRSYYHKFSQEAGDPYSTGRADAVVHKISLAKKKPESGTKLHKKIEFYAKNCVLKYEFSPRLDEYTSTSYWDNGGKAKVEMSDGYTKEWDRMGNLIEYWPNGENTDHLICSNTNKKYKSCS